MGHREALAENLERHVFTVGDAVRVEKLGNQFLELLNQCVHIVRFGGETGDLSARRDPDPDFVVPYRIDDESARSVHAAGSIATGIAY